MRDFLRNCARDLEEKRHKDGCVGSVKWDFCERPEVPLKQLGACQ